MPIYVFDLSDLSKFESGDLVATRFPDGCAVSGDWVCRAATDDEAKIFAHRAAEDEWTAPRSRHWQDFRVEFRDSQAMGLVKKAPRRRIVTLSGRPPVSIVESEWPQISHAFLKTKEDPADQRTLDLRVRRHSDGRVLVYGTLATTVDEEHPAGEGVLLTADEATGFVVVNMIGATAIALTRAAHKLPDSDALPFARAAARLAIERLPAEEI